MFEGLDRAGKTTQCQMLVDALQKEGQQVKFMRFPGACIEAYTTRAKENKETTER